MRENPDLNQLKRQAKELRDAYCAKPPEAIGGSSCLPPHCQFRNLVLHDAQFVLARALKAETRHAGAARAGGAAHTFRIDAVSANGYPPAGVRTSGQAAADRGRIDVRKPGLIATLRGHYSSGHSAIFWGATTFCVFF
jgi:hypothetical protein